jgi:hypothetical protein
MSRVLAPILLGLMILGVARAQVQPVLVLSFDKDFNGAGPRGPIAATLVGKPELAPGKFGQALRAGPSFGHLQFPTAGLLRREAGAVEMWVCPVDWKSDDAKFHVFFEVRGRGAFYFYKYWTNTDLLMLTCPEVEGPYASSRIPTDFKPGEWHHIAGTWSRDGVMAYVDGKPADKMPLEGELPRELGPFLQIGDDPWQFPRTTSSLLDDVRIYDHALTPAHVAAHFAGNYDFTVPLAAETTRLTYQIDGLVNKVNVRLDTGGADVPDAQLHAKLAVVAKGQALPEDTQVVGFTDGQVSQAMPLPARAGDYDVVALVMPEAGQAFELRRPLTIPTTDWLGNRIGMDDKVLPPWTPMRRDGTALSCWNRRYTFGGAILPTQINSAGADLLARPVALNLTSGGKPVAWAQQRMAPTSSSPTRCELKGVADAKVGAVEARFRSHVTAEYDGLVLIEIGCDKPAELPLDGLTIDVPVKAEHALYEHRWEPTWKPSSGYVRKGEGVVDKTAFVPFAWLGDNDRGLFWCCESDEMWPNRAAEDCIQILRSGSEIVLRLNVLAAGQKLPANWNLVFALQATPVKPMPRDWRKWRLTGWRETVGANVEIVWPYAGKENSLSAFGYPEAQNLPVFRKYIDDLHKRGIKAVPYLCLTWLTDGIPEWQYFRRVWDAVGIDPSIPAAGWRHGWHLVSPVARGYSDFIIWKTRQFMEQSGIDGMYHDQTSPYPSSALDAGLGYLRDGRPMATYPILGYRALYRRNYAMAKSLGRETFTMAHMSGKVLAPVLAYDDSYLDGEYFVGVVKDSYMDVMTLDAFRAEHMGRQWGMMPFFLPEFDGENQAKIEPTRGLMALLMIHDVSPWAIWCNGKVADEAFRALDKFGYAAADFLPYFDPKPPATTDMKDVYVSAYTRPDRRALLIVGNVGKEDRKGEVRIDAARLGLPLTRVLNWPDAKPLAVSNGRVELEVPRLGYRMVLVDGGRK